MYHYYRKLSKSTHSNKKIAYVTTLVITLFLLAISSEWKLFIIAIIAPVNFAICPIFYCTLLYLPP